MQKLLSALRLQNEAHSGWFESQNQFFIQTKQLPDGSISVIAAGVGESALQHNKNSREKALFCSMKWNPTILIMLFAFDATSISLPSRRERPTGWRLEEGACRTAVGRNRSSRVPFTAIQHNHVLRITKFASKGLFHYFVQFNIKLPKLIDPISGT